MGRKRMVSFILTLVMAFGLVTMPAPVQAEGTKTVKAGYDTESGVVIKSDSGKVKGVIPKGEHDFVITFKLSKVKEITLIPKIQYMSQDAEYDKSVKDLESTATLYKDGKEYKGYQSLEGNDPFLQAERKTATIKMKNRTSSKQPYYSMKQLLEAGEYQVIFRVPEQVSAGAKILLEYEFEDIYDTEENERFISSNTKDTARKVSVPYRFDNFYYDVGVLTSGDPKAYWYKAVLPGERRVGFSISYTLYDADQRIKLEIIQASTGKTVKTYVIKDEEEVQEEGMADGYYSEGTIWDEEGISLKKGTYYIKVSAMQEDTDAYFSIWNCVGRAKSPQLTYWALGKKVIKGTCQEPGARAYASINGKTYKSKEKIGADGTFTIAIPKVKAGTELDVYVIDAKGYYGASRVVKVQAIPNPPKMTSYKRGSRTLKGTTTTYSTVTVVYDGKTYTAKTGKKNYFTITTDTTLKKGKKFTVKVRRNSGNVSKTKTYTIQ